MIIKFETNVPVTLALKYVTGEEAPSKIADADPEMVYKTTAGDIFYAKPALENKLHALIESGLRAGDEITICKREVRREGKPRIEWIVGRTGESEAPPAAQRDEVIPRQATGNNNQRSNPPVKTPLDRALTMFLLMAGRSTRDAERVLGAEGGSVRFDSRDVAALATTMLIQASRDGFIGWIEPETAQRYVAELKIDGLKKPAAPEPAAPVSRIPSTWSTKGEMRQVFAKLREMVGEGEYQRVMAGANVDDPAQFRTAKAALTAYAELVAVLKSEAA